MSETLTGMGIVPGKAVGPAFAWRRSMPPADGAPAARPETELSRLENALQTTRYQLLETIQKVEPQFGTAGSKILRTHLALLDDPMLLDQISRQIGQGISAVDAVLRVTAGLAARLETLTTPRLRERATDLRDVGNRLAENLVGTTSWEGLKSAAGILCAPDLTPSEVSCLDPQRVHGIVLEGGTTSSHTAILVRALGIPTVMGTKGLLARLNPGDSVFLNGGTGEVILGAEKEAAECGGRRLPTLQQSCGGSNPAKIQPAVTLDGFRVEISANVGSPAEVDSAIASGAEGIGVFRTEFLFLNRDKLPSEEEQFVVYSGVLAAMNPCRVVLRTADMGGDKQAAFLGLQPEPNPSLGLRGIRLSFRREEFFRTQVRAMLRASSFGNLCILLPMVTDIAEVRRARTIIDQLAREMREGGDKIAGRIPVGVMIETPASALMADSLARESEFLSIGTNDLTQYVLAADRLNEQVAYLYQPFHPAVLRLMDEVARAAERNGKPFSVCGEFAGDPVAAALFVGLGVTELSMSPARIGPVREAIGKFRKAEVVDLVRETLSLSYGHEVSERLRRFTEKGAAASVRSHGEDS